MLLFLLLVRFGCFAFAFAFGCTLDVLLGGDSLFLLRGRNGETATIGTADGDAFALLLLLLEEAHGGGLFCCYVSYVVLIGVGLAAGGSMIVFVLEAKCFR